MLLTTTNTSETYFMMMSGQKVRKPMQACLQENFRPLDPGIIILL